MNTAITRFLLLFGAMPVLLLAADTAAQDAQPPPAEEPQPAPPQPTAPETITPEPSPADSAAAPIANTDPAYGPPEAAFAPPTAYAGDGVEPGWYVDKEDDPYWDLTGAWDWEHDAYLATLCFLNMYLHDDDDDFGFHGRFLALGALTFERRLIADDGSVERERKWTFVLEVFDAFMRAYLAGPVFLSLGPSFGVAFYDSLVPTLDFQGGLGFQYGGWGLEAGLRSSRLPREVVVVGGQELARIGYAPMVYVNIETNIHW